MNKITLKKGDTFSVVCTYKDSSGVPINLTTTSTTIASQVRTASGELVADLTADVLDQTLNTGQYRLTAATTEWPLSILVWDIQYTQAGVIASTETISLNLVAGVTE